MKSIISNLFKYWLISRILRIYNYGHYFLFLQLISIPIYKKIFGIRPRLLHLKFKDKKFNFFVRDSADIAVLSEVFVDTEYKLKLEETPHYIIDIGSHIGASVVFFKLLYPDSIIVAYEPNIKNFDLLIKNTSQFTNITCINSVIDSESGYVEFYHSHSSISSSMTKRNYPMRVEKVIATGFDEIISQNGVIDLIKYDVEGLEYKLFSKSKKINLVKAFIGELHLDLIRPASKNDFYNFFNSFSIEEKKISNYRYIVSAIRK